MATELRELRRLIGNKLGLVTVLEARYDSESTDTLRDTVKLADRGDDAPSVLNRLLYFSGGTEANWGHEAAITTFNSSTRTVTFDPPAPAMPVTGDEAELWATAETLPDGIGSIHRLINFAISQVSRYAGLEAYATDATFSARTGTLVIPAEWSGGTIGGVEWNSPTGYINEVSERYLRVRPGARTVEIYGHGAMRADRKTVRLYGYPPATPLAAEDDTTPVQAEWIVESVTEALTLARSAAMTDPAAAERRANFWAARASLYRRNIMSARRGMGVSIP
jgi:hypothetical protein